MRVQKMPSLVIREYYLGVIADPIKMPRVRKKKSLLKRLIKPYENRYQL